MNNKELEKFLNIIESRTRKVIAENKFLKQYCGKIEGLVYDSANKPISSKYKVRLLSDDTEFTFLNKTGEKLNVGDYVYIQTTGTDLNTGVIIYKTKESYNNVDYIVEEGKIADETIGTWEYRKWNSGIAECWGYKAQSITITEKISDSLFYSSTSFERSRYPIAFIETPNEQANFTGTTEMMGWLYSQAGNSFELCGRYNIMSWKAFSKPTQVKINYSVKGRWK